MIRHTLRFLLIVACIAISPGSVATSHAQKAPPPTMHDFLTQDIDEAIIEEFIVAYEEAEWPRWLTVVGMDARAFGGDADHRRIAGRDTPLLFFDPTGLTDAFRARLNSILVENPDLDLLDLDGLEDADRRRAEGITSDGAQEVVEMMGERVGADIVFYVEVRAVPDELRNEDEPLFKVFYRLQDRRTDRLITENTFPWSGRSDPKYLKFLAVQTLSRALPDFAKRAGRVPTHQPMELFVQAIGDAHRIEIKRALEGFEGMRGRINMEMQRRGNESLTVYRFRYSGDLDELLYDLNLYARADLGLEFRTQDKRMTSAVLLAQAAEAETPDWLRYTSESAPGHDEAIRALRDGYDRRGAPVVGVVIDPDDPDAGFDVRALSQQLSARFREAGLQIEMVRGKVGWDVRDLGFDIVVLGESDRGAFDGGSFMFSVFDVRNDRFIDAQAWPQQAAIRSRRHPIDPSDMEAVSRYVAGSLLASLSADFSGASLVDVMMHFVNDTREVTEFASAIADSVAPVERVSNIQGGRGCATFTIRYRGDFMSLVSGLERILDRYSVSLAGSSIDSSLIELVVLEPGQTLADVEIPEEHDCAKRALPPRTPSQERPSEDIDETPDREPRTPDEPETRPTPDTPEEGEPETPRDDERRPRDPRSPGRDRGPSRGPVRPTTGAIEAVQSIYNRISASDPTVQSATVRSARVPEAPGVEFDGILVIRKADQQDARNRRGIQFDDLKDAVIGEIEVIKGRKGGADVLRSRAFQQELSDVKNDPTVEFAMPNYIFHASAALPATRLAKAQWAYENEKNPDCTANILPALEKIKSISPSLIGVVDAGIHVSDPRMQPALWVNQNEVPGNNRDDDRNGHVDDVHGFNFIDNSATLDWGRTAPNHGTFCASQIAARTVGGSNDVIGVAPNAKVLTAVGLGADGSGSFDAILKSLDYAADNGAKVINLSLGGTVESFAVLDQLAQNPVFRKLRAKGVILVVAAGNDAQDIDRIPSFPAGLNLDNIISVAAIDPDGRLGRGQQSSGWAQYSNYGIKNVDIGAPGSRMLGVSAHGVTEMWDGTSMAAPMVTATVALIQGLHPDWDYKTVIRAVTESARPYEALEGKVRTGASLDVDAALNWTP